MLLLTATACTEPTLDTSLPRRFEARMADEVVHRPCGEPKVARRGELRAVTCADAELGTLGEHDPLAWMSPAADEIAQADPPGHLARWLPPAADARELRRNISSLESRDDEPTARHLTALGALYHALALATGDARHLVDAYEHTAHALEIEPESPAALFNRALVASDLGLCHQALEGFRAYLDADGDSPWAVEARMRRGALPCGPGAAVEETNDDLFEEAIEELLLRWAETWAKDRETADGLLDEIAELGERLERGAGDPWVSEVVTELRQADARHVEGVRACTEGRALFDDHRWREARQPLEDSEDLLPASSLVRPWCHVWLVGLRMSDGPGALDAAIEFLEDDRRDPRVLASPLLAGRIHWSSGLAALRGARLEEGRQYLTTARRALARGGYGSFEGAVRTLESEALLNLGFVLDSWRTRAAALRALQDPAPIFALHNGLMSGARATSLRGAFRLAHALLDEAAQTVANQTEKVEVLLSRGDVYLRQQNDERAAEQYRSAADLSAGIDQATARDRLDARAQVGLWASHGATTKDHIDQAISYFAARGPAWREIEARRVAAHGGDVADLGTGLQAALDRIHQIENEISDRSLGFTYWESIQSVYDEALDWTLEHRGAVAALKLLEEARQPGRETSPDLPTTCRAVGEARERASRASREATGPLVVTYGVFGDGIVWWRIDGESCTFSHSDRSLVASTLTRVLAAAPDGEVEDRDLETLYRELLAEPLRNTTPERSLILVPDRFLLQIPFAALVDPATGRAVVESHPVSYRLTVGAALESRLASSERGSWRALTVGDPDFDSEVHLEDDLPFTEHEARAIAALYGEQARLLLHDEATADNVRAALSDVQVFHLASHVVPAADGSGDFLLLAQDGSRSGLTSSSQLLEASDSSLELVVLSACSALGTVPSRSGGLVGAAQPFITRGTPAVVGTLWSVPDEAMAPIVTRFHELLLSGEPASEALRQAQIEARRNARSFAWAALQLVGELHSPSP